MRLLLFIVIFSTSGFVPAQAQYGTTLWYRQPANNWNEALPVGNGRLGAMVFGGVQHEKLSLNESTLWSGGPRDWNNPTAKKYLPLVRAAIVQKQYHVADSLSGFMQGPYTESYLPLADLQIDYAGVSDSVNYRRALNIDVATSQVQFTSQDKEYYRTVFASFPDNTIVYHDSCNRKSSVSFNVQLTSKLHYRVQTLAPNHIVLKGKCPRHVDPVYLWKIKDDDAIQYANSEHGEGMNFEVHLLVNTQSGIISCSNNIIQVENADAATLLISAATSYNGYKNSPGRAGKNPSLRATTDINKASSKSFKTLLRNHVHDYQPIFRRVTLDLGGTINHSLPTDERLKKLDGFTDPELIATIAQYGRYLLIAGSRNGQPVNLKGIWNDKVRPEYSSNWCIDHDAQMFYYPVETNNLSEMHGPFLQLIEDLAVNGEQTASINYGLRGWCAHHNTDIWRQTAPVGNYGEGNPHWATWNMSGPWLCAHLYDHYLFTGDKKFLLQKAWPVMKGAALFCLDWLIKDTNGQLISMPSVSPENTFITANGDTAQISRNSTADIALIKELFLHCVQAAHILKIENGFVQQLKQAIAELPAYKTGSQGQLLEWEEEWRPVDPSHRHLSHLYPVFPGNEISPLHTPGLAIAAKKALTCREKSNSSWGFALKAACWARLNEGDSAWQTLQHQLRYVKATGKSSVDNYGLYPNLFNSEVPATIMNGNGCTTAVITEMLLQSHTGEIQLLPALPAPFIRGSVKGLCARGGFVINIDWENHRLSGAVIRSTQGNECRLVAGVPVKIYAGATRIKPLRENKDILVFKTIKGQQYSICPRLK